MTSSDRAFSESERKFLELIHEWRKKVVVVLSKIDLVESSDDLVCHHFLLLLSIFFSRVQYVLIV